MTENTRTKASFLTKSKQSDTSQDITIVINTANSIWEMPSKKLESLKSL